MCFPQPQNRQGRAGAMAWCRPVRASSRAACSHLDPSSITRCDPHLNDPKLLHKLWGLILCHLAVHFHHVGECLEQHQGKNCKKLRGRLHQGAILVRKSKDQREMMAAKELFMKP